MDNVMYYICYPLGYIMKWCREQVGNYGLAIILFTLVTKLVILPVSVWVHKNSIRMVSIQPQINRLKAKFYGDRERIAEEQTALYRQVGYNPFANSIPLLIQLLLLAAVVYIIKQPLTHVLRLDGSTIRALADALGVSAKEGQLEIVRAAAEGRFSALTEKYADVPAAELTFELDFSSNRSIYSSDLLITDWSAIAYEFCFSTKRPVLFVNTKIKMENPDYRDIPDIPVEISLRDEVGRSLEKQELADSVNSTARALIADRAAWEKQITDLLHRHLFSYGQNGAPGVTYILTRLRDIQTARKQAEATARKGK